jgi:hypothetical protein
MMLLVPQLKPDSCPQTKRFETMGLSREQAEKLAVYLSEQIVLDRMRLSEQFTAKVELEKVSSSLNCLHASASSSSRQCLKR